MARRDEEKKRRRQKRLQKRGQHQLQAMRFAPDLEQFRELAEVLAVSEPSTFPGGCDPSLAKPDAIKFALAAAATEREPGRSKFRQLKNVARRGLLGDLDGFVDNWLIEEYLWHGAPGDSWHPVDNYLRLQRNHFQPPAVEQLRLWKLAELGLFEVGAVSDDTLMLQPWDLIQGKRIGRPLRAISLNIGGVNAYRSSAGAITITYLAPWVPADNLYCAMGYGLTLAKADAGMLGFYLPLQHPAIVCRPLPWKVNRAAEDAYLRQWRSREWYGWFRDRLQFPFWALVGMPPDGEPKVMQVTELVPSEPLHAAQFGIYLGTPFDKDMCAAGATMVEPIDVTTANAMLFAEYKAYRAVVGPPPGTKGMPKFAEITP